MRKMWKIEQILNIKNLKMSGQNTKFFSKTLVRAIMFYSQLVQEDPTLTSRDEKEIS